MNYVYCKRLFMSSRNPWNEMGNPKVSESGWEFNIRRPNSLWRKKKKKKKNNDARPLRSDGASEKLSKAIRSDKALTAIDKDYWAPLFSEDRTKGTANHQNAMEAADLGLKALDKLGRYDLPKDGKITGDDRVWFLYEDQTIGLPTAAHLINKGHSAKNIKKYYDTVNKNFDYYKDYERYFDVRESGGSEYISEFVDACESIKKQKSK